MRVPGSAPTAALSLVLLVAASCGEADTGAPEAAAPGTGPGPGAGDSPNVILLVLDTLRSDHLSCYGYPRPTTPEIDAFAASATRYARTRSPAPWTLPSHASMFTGLHPFQHAAHSLPDGFLRSRGLGGGNVNPLSEHHVTLAEVFQAAGFETGAFVANRAYLDEKFQLDQGFDTYVCDKGKVDSMNQRALEWIEGVGRPFFLFVNYMDTHRPYNTAPRPGFLDGRDIPEDSAANLDRAYELILSGEDPEPRELLDTLIDQYDLGIANLDEGIGRLLERLGALGLADDTLVVITSDHGEYLGEHRLIEHSKDVYEPGLRVPLVVREPGQAQGRVVETPVSTVQLPHLILGIAGLVEPARELGFAAEDAATRELLAENHFTRRKDLAKPWGKRFQRVRKVIYEGSLKLIDSSDGHHELYDLATDPAETRNLAISDPERLRALRERLAGLHRDHQHPRYYRDVPESAEDRKMLEELGYIQGSSSSEPPPDDPEDGSGDG